MRTQSPLTNALEAHARQQRAERIVVVTGLVGVAVAAFALWWPQPDGPSVVVPLRAIEVPVAPASPSPTPVSEAAPAVVDGGAIEVAAKMPVVAIAHEDPASDFLAIARLETSRGELEAALTALRKHLYQAPPTTPVLLDVARLAMVLRHYALAEQALLDAGALEPNNAEIAVERGRVLLEAGELVEARTAARLAIKLDAESPSAWNLAGRVALAESHWDRAELAFRQAVQRDPTDPMLHNNLGLLYVHMKKADLAIDALETSRELYGDDAPAFVLNNLGLAYEQAHRLTEARDAFADALTVLPDYARAQLNLRRVLDAEAQQTEATAHAERTAELESEARAAKVLVPVEELDEEDEGSDD